MSKGLALGAVLLAATLTPVAASPPARDAVEQCVQVASWAACDQETGYIAGPGGPCAAHDLRCVRDEWRRIGNPITSPQLGRWCGRSHEDGGTLVLCEPGTLPAGGPASDPDLEPPPPPPPPTADEARSTCPDPGRPTIGRDPDPEGLTGLPTYLWAGPQSSISTTTTIRGYPVRCTATPTTWRWHSGDGSTYTRGSHGAPPPGHTVEHVYERADVYQLRVVVTWRLKTNYGSGSTVRSRTEPYKVIEVRSVIVN